MELQRRLADFTAAGVRLFAISPDRVEDHATFAEQHGITYPLLADTDSAVIRRYGILNTLVEPDEDLYGMPFPGAYLSGADGVVTQKFFHRRYQQREAPEVVLIDGLNLPVDLSAHPAASGGAEVSAVLSSPVLTTMQRTSLRVRIALDPGEHIYGQPVPSGYIPTTVRVTAPPSVQVGEPQYPPTAPFRIDGIAETFHVFTGDVEIEVPLVSAEREATEVTLTVEVGYQTCTDRECFLPRTVTLAVSAPVQTLLR